MAQPSQFSYDCWSYAYWRIPEWDRPLVHGIYWVYQWELQNIYSYELPCGEALPWEGTFRWAVEWGCNNWWEYTTDAMIHEIGHIVMVYWYGDWTEQAADNYARWVKGAPLVWDPPGQAMPELMVTRAGMVPV